VDNNVINLAIMKEDCKRFADKGGDEAKFWSGRMSIYIAELIGCNIYNAGSVLRLLNQVRLEYDSVVFSRVKD